MVAEVVQALKIHRGGRFIDCTVGEGGHSLAILGAGASGVTVLGIDADPVALERATQRLRPFEARVTLVQGTYAGVGDLAQQHSFAPADGVLFDLGLSSLQLQGEGRGFSFYEEMPLDMRFDPQQEVTAADLVNRLSAEALARIFLLYGEERQARRVAGAILQSRPLYTALELARVVERALGGRRGRIHPATRVFQSLRIAVNRELEQLEQGLSQAIALLGPGAPLAVLSYHSLEDRLVKGAMRQAAAGCICPPGMPVCTCGHTPELRLVTKKPLTPSAEEVRSNPRSRSARLRVAEHLV